MGRYRRILHVDLDAFFASVEQNENPLLKGKPVIIGGQSDRGVVATCSYEARLFGVHSAMPMYKAKELCKDAICLNGNHKLYSDYSRRVFKILSRYAKSMEKVSIDEAYLELDENAESSILAKKIKEDVFENTGLTLSIGISYNKFLAKLASEWNKPNGTFMITPDMIPELLFPMKISKIHGLGKKTAEKLYKMNIGVVEDLYKLSKREIIFILGENYGLEIYNKIRGIDCRKIKTKYERKSIGVERTLRENLSDRNKIWSKLEECTIEVEEILKKKNLSAKTITIKYKYEDFENQTRSRTLPCGLAEEKEILNAVKRIFEQINFEKRVRLLGVSVSNLEDLGIRQLSFVDFE
jgi:DNA polymerase-4